MNQTESGQSADIEMLARWRADIIPLWIAHHQSVARQPKRLAVPADPAAFMCKHASLYLQLRFAAIGQAWRVVGGNMRASNGENHSHWWLENDARRVDITASQFGYEDVLITDLDDDRYTRVEEYCRKDWWGGLRRTVKAWLQAIEPAAA